MAIDQTSVYGSTATYFLSLFRNSALIVDTNNPARTKSDWILPAFPVKDSLNRPNRTSDNPGFPLIVIESPDVAQSIGTFNQRFRSAKLNIWILQVGNVAHLDTISSQVMRCMTANENDMNLNGIYNLTVAASGHVERSMDAKNYHQRLIRVAFAYSEMVSA